MMNGCYKYDPLSAKCNPCPHKDPHENLGVHCGISDMSGDCPVCTELLTSADLPLNTAQELITAEYERLLRFGTERLTRLLAAESVIDRLTADASKFRELLTALTEESLENCRLLGVSASKEAVLQAKIRRYQYALRASGAGELVIIAIEKGRFDGKDL